MATNKAYLADLCNRRFGYASQGQRKAYKMASVSKVSGRRSRWASLRSPVGG
jgi:hypothetical protein